MVLDIFQRRELRARSIKLFGSPNFPVTLGAIAASGGQEQTDMAEDFPASARYGPLESMVLTNNSGADVNLDVNGVPYSLIPAGVIETIFQAVSSFRITNDSLTAVAAGEITANLKTPPLGADEAARNAFQKRRI